VSRTMTVWERRSRVEIVYSPYSVPRHKPIILFVFPPSSHLDHPFPTATPNLERPNAHTRHPTSI
jgi:hypothetical protein